MSLLRFFLIVSLCVFHILNLSAQDWKFVGLDYSNINLPSNGNATYTSIVVDSNDVVYVACVDQAFSNKAAVKKYVNGSWSSVGNPISPGLASYVQIVLDTNDVPYVVYCDQTNGNKVSVQKFESGIWQLVGVAGFSAGAAVYIQMAIDTNTNVPYVVYRDATKSNKATVQKFESGIWQVVGTAGFSLGSADYTQIALDKNGIPYVVYSDGGRSNKATVQKFESGTWQLVGTGGFSQGIVGNTQIAIDTNNVPYVSYADNANGNKITVQKFDLGTWQSVGALGFSASNVTYSHIVIEKNSNTPYVAYSEQGAQSRVIVQKFDLGAWQIVGDIKLLFQGQGLYVQMKFNKTGELYLTHQCGIGNSYATVRKFEAGNWIILGKGGISNAAVGLLSVAVDSNNISYIAYCDSEKGLGATVKMYQNGIWQTLESNGFSHVKINDCRIKIGQNRTPYIFYTEDVTNKPIVKKFDSGTWQTVGTIDFPQAGYELDIEICKDGVPYVAYTSNGITYVYKLVSDNWQLFGSGINDGYAIDMDMAVDDNGTPYVVYRDILGFSNNKITAYKFDSGSWQLLGPKGFSVGSVAYPSIAIGENNIPHVAYVDNGLNSTAVVKRFISGAWQNMGSAGFTNSGITKTNLMFDRCGTPYLQYVDGQFVIQRFVSTNQMQTWQTVGDVGFSIGETGTDATIAIGIDGEIFAGYSHLGFAFVQNINAFPTLQINNPAPVCSPETIDITNTLVTAGSQLAGSTLSYWNDAIALNPIPNPDAITAGGTYYIKAQVGTGCNDISPVLVTINQTPELTITNPAMVNLPNTVDITAASITFGSSLTSATLSYWNDVDAASPLASPSTISTTGTYYIKAETSPGCYDIKPVTVTVRSLTALDDITAANKKVNVYPNPSEGNVFIEFKNTDDNNIIIELLNVHGQVVYKSSEDEIINGKDTLHLSLEKYPSGIYLLKTKMGEETHLDKIILK